MSEEIIVYKIRRKSDGLFSNGGENPIFMKRGKMWTNIGHIKNHFNGIREAHTSKKYLEFLYKNCEIVTFLLSEADSIDIIEFLEKGKT